MRCLCTFGNPYSFGRRYVSFNVDLILLGMLLFFTRILMFCAIVLVESLSSFLYVLSERMIMRTDFSYPSPHFPPNNSLLPLHHSTSSVIYKRGDPEEQLSINAPRSELQSSRNVGILRMDLDTEETRKTHNFYIERNIICGILSFLISFSSLKQW